MALQTKVFYVSSNTYTLRLTVSENSTSIGGNNSSVSFRLELISTTKDFYNYAVGRNVYLDGRLVASISRGDASSRVNLPTGSSVTLLSGTTTIGHDNEGTKTMSVAYSIDMASASYTPGPMNGSGSMPLTNIPRGATIASAPNFTDEDNPTVKVNNPAGVAVQLAIYKDSTHAIADYRTISGTSYTFQLTSAERDLLRQVSITSNTAQVRFYVKSVVGGQTFISYLTRTVTIKNPAPTLSPTVDDTNPTTVSLTGGGSIVRYASNARCVFNDSGVKFATINSRKVTNGAQSRTSDGVIPGVASGDFDFSTTDSRGNTTSKRVSLPLVPYITLTCYIGNNVPKITGEFDLACSGSAFNGSFGLTDNALTVEYRYKEQYADEWGLWLPMESNQSGDSYTANAHLEGLDPKATYSFQCRVTDKVSAAESEERTVVCRPYFSATKDSFRHHSRLGFTTFDDDGNEEPHWLERCGMTARIASSVSLTGGEVEIPLGAVLQEFGGCELSGRGVKVANDGLYIVSASVYFSQMVSPMYVGLYVRSGITEVVSSHTGISGGIGAVVAPSSLVALSAGDVVNLYAYTPPGLTATVSNDTRTRLTVAQIY